MLIFVVYVAMMAFTARILLLRGAKLTGDRLDEFSVILAFMCALFWPLGLPMGYLLTIKDPNESLFIQIITGKLPKE